MTRYTITQYIEKIETSYNTKFHDDFKDRFKENLKGVLFYENGTYILADLDKAWKNSGSDNCYDDRGIIFI
ncbi:hypothetical protein [Aliivibrio fischeri]|uniref:Uncharacterized protein n=1 Tax=Aliivibrio fischeri TaxID=668 RepID=A0A510UNX9_ALIFS|nr:hypothetical protein [Aliivibrio fischeri]GEK16249.1 hypothetical protein AFI02nite_42850 [Aliivibrio fischeri]